MSNQSDFPCENPTLSYWQARSRGSTLLHHRTTVDVPQQADVVIVGSGFSGAVVAHTLLTLSDAYKPSIVMLEARELCSGATARNGGHTRPDRFAGYNHYKSLFGKEQALKVIHNERDNFKHMHNLVSGIECDAWFGRTYDVWLDENMVKIALTTYNEFAADGGDVSEIEIIKDPDEAARLTRVRSAKGAASWPAGSLFPFKLVEGLLSIALSLGLNLQTYTPALSVTQSKFPATDSLVWSVQTPRGVINTPCVIHATNAFASTLLPSLKNILEPWRGQCSAHIPPSNYTGSSTLKHTMSLRTSGTLYDYLIQRPGDGTVIVGGARCAVDITKDFRLNTNDADLVDAATKHLETCLVNTLEGWEIKAFGEGMESTWTGIMGYTKDSVPLVGSVPSLPGQFCCVGFHGHGMARIATAARGTALLAVGRPWSKTELPECFSITESRLNSSIDVLTPIALIHKSAQ